MQVRTEENRRWQGKTLAEAAAALGTDPIEAAMDLISVLTEGAFADVVVFDPVTVADRATFGHPHQLSAGVSEVLVNGTVTISGGSHSGALAGRALAGPGARR